MERRLFKKSGFITSVFALALSLMVSACGNAGGGETKGGAGGKINVVTTIAQIAEPISVIGGDKVSVQSLMGPGVDPHLYNATQGDIRKLEGGDVRSAPGS